MPTPTLDELTLADEPENWERLGFTVADGCCRLGEVSMRFAGEGTQRGIVGWSLRDLQSTELDGLATAISRRPAPTDTVAHANGAVAIDHIVAMSPAFQRSVDSLQAAGLDLRRVREEPTPAGAPRQAFFRVGREILELVQEPAAVVDAAGGPDHPARFWGLAVLVEDLDRTVELMAPHVGSLRPAVQPGRRIATLRRSAGLSVPLALMSPDERNEESR
jgi:hypothetical protein